MRNREQISVWILDEERLTSASVNLSAWDMRWYLILRGRNKAGFHSSDTELNQTCTIQSRNNAMNTNGRKKYIVKVLIKLYRMPGVKRLSMKSVFYTECLHAGCDGGKGSERSVL